MKKSIIAAAIGAALMGVFPVFAQGQAQGGDRFQALADLGPGVHNTKLDESGNLKSFMAVGTGRIRKSLPKSVAKKQAQKDAAREARNEVSKFFNTSVKWGENAQNQMVCVVKGESQGEEAGTSTEKSEFSEATAEASKAASEAALSGLRKVWAGYSKDGDYVEIWGWQYAVCQALINAGRAMGAAARATVNEAKAVEGARSQDPNAAYQKAEARDAANANAGVAPTAAAPARNSGSALNEAPTRTSAAAPDADDFF